GAVQRGGRSPGFGPYPPIPASQTGRQPLYPPPSLVAAFQRRASPASSVHPTRKSYPAVRSVPPSAVRPRFQPPPFPFPPPALRICVAHMPPLAAQAASCDPPSHSPSTAAFPAEHTPPEPYIQAVSVTDNRVTAPLLLTLPSPRPLLLGPYSRPPAVCLQVHLRAPPPPLLSPQRLLPVAPRSPLTQSGIPGSLPGSHSAPKTRSSRPPSIFPCPQ